MRSYIAPWPARASCLICALAALAATQCVQPDDGGGWGGRSGSGGRGGGAGAGSGGSGGGAAGSAGYDVTRYDLKGAFDWGKLTLNATVVITLEPEADGLREVVFDSAVAAVKAVRRAGGGPLPFSVDGANGRLEVEVSGGRGLARGEPMSIEIDYEAEANDWALTNDVASLIASPALRGDPVAVRTLFTVSEPLGAARWMPCHNVPSDRAVFSVEMSVAPHETMVASGTLVADEADEGSRRVRYETGYTLPTYLMSFAVGDFEVEEATAGGGLPIQIWHRRGVRSDYGSALAEVAKMAGRYQALLGPYPFEKYALVFVPGGWGMEHAGVSLHGELQLNLDLGSALTVAAHEFAHQWFGDLVTIEGWGDLWFKEGAATLLEIEGVRDRVDRDGLGALGGDDYVPISGVPARDLSITDPAQQFTSGPYRRGAWLLAQVRSLAGEGAFWQAMRGVLDAHRFGAVTSDEFVDAFAPALGPAAHARLRRAVGARGLPRLEVAAAPSGGTRLALRDPEGALVAPIDLRWIAADGTTRAQTLAPGDSIELAPQSEGELLTIDPYDLHPDLAIFAREDGDASAQAYAERVTPLLVPSGAPALEHWLRGGGTHQFALLRTRLPELAPEGFTAFLGALDSEPAAALAVQKACQLAASPGLDPPTREAWSAAIEGALRRPPYAFGLSQLGSGRYTACANVVDVGALFASDWALLETGLPEGGMSETRAAFLARLPLPPPLDFAAWSNVATRADTASLRRTAAQRLARSAAFAGPEDVAAFRSFFVGLLSTTEDPSGLFAAIQGAQATGAATAAENAEALAALGTTLHNRLTKINHRDAVCAAFSLAAGDEGAWADFVASAEDAPLGPGAAEALADPASCN